MGGPGLLESVYEDALAEELTSRRLTVRRQVPVPIVYKGRQLELALRLDLLVEELAIVECKAVAKLSDVSANQTLTYLRCSDRRLGLNKISGSAHSVRASGVWCTGSTNRRSCESPFAAVCRFAFRCQQSCPIVIERRAAAR